MGWISLLPEAGTSCLMVFQSQGYDVTLGELVLGSRVRNYHVALAKVCSEGPVRLSHINSQCYRWGPVRKLGEE